MDKLTGHQSNLRIIPIVGMGGIGKTTLARNIYVNPVIVQHFDLRGWTTISQEYNSKGILFEVLKTMGSKGDLSQISEDKLGDKLYKSLCGWRYLIVLDDIWSIEAWDKVKTFFPDNDNGSRIMVTTRLSKLASQLSGSDGSLNSTFGEESCPLELEGIGKKIVENCKGLPLSIVVIGGLLAKSKRTREYWLYISANLNSIVNSEDNEHCLKILHLSYKELSVHLKPCFLYMGVYPEDWVIHVPVLLRLWVAEGFLKPISGKCLEEVAKEYFNDLLDRNLVLVNKRGWIGETIECKVHDLLVDLCVKEAQKHKFLYVARHHNFNNRQDLNTERRMVVHNSTKPKVIHTWLSHHGTLVRSLTSKDSASFPKKHNSRLLKVLNLFDHETLARSLTSKDSASFPKKHDSRLLWVLNLFGVLPSSIYSLWNLQTLHVSGAKVATSEIWNMSQLRHVQINELYLLDPPPSGFVLGNLQTLSNVINFKFSEEVVKRIPNIKELGVYYKRIVDWSSYCLDNLVQLTNLESLYFEIRFGEEPIPSEMMENLTFPRSLKELTLEGTRIKLGDLGAKIGSLPHLQVLKLKWGSLVGPEWETIEGQFRSLKYLDIIAIRDLKYWRTESWTHFPCLEHLSLSFLPNLEEIPLEIGETLKSIEMESCSESALISANEILKEQEDLGNQGLHVKVTAKKEQKQVVESLAGPNFQVEFW
ncbi:putative late blight resistance protein homolog r1a-6 [Phtheirospermum japonicum]|uniref:Putative late blight resistance protein homolog r1a-6 n=1 Tax=Phtheirospermum japonicum TaxID=374723 RepID=A0A830D4W6_9LAMI|nr:putative late blight resistance protein homolog r1a-6 [Phtheirospermum japonicum]